MTNTQKSDPAGESKDEMTGPPQATQSSSEESPSISVTLVSTPHPSQISQATRNSLANQTHAKVISAFASKLGELVEWRRIELGDGRTGFVLFFDDKKWSVDPVTKELLPS